MKYTMIFMCKYSNEMITRIKAIEFYERGLLEL